MKQIFTIFAIVFFTATLWAQSPEKMSYQAVIRNSSDILVTNTQIGMQISILQGSISGTAVYTETHTPTTNTNGLVSIEVGAGTTGDDFSAIDWANGPYFIKTEIDPAGGTSYTITGTGQILSVPYALHAKTAETLKETLSLSDVLSEGNNANATAIVNVSQIGVGTETPNSGAILDLNSTTQVLLPPRMTEAERDAISSPPAGGIVFNTTTQQMEYYSGEVGGEFVGTLTPGTWAQYDGPIHMQSVITEGTGKILTVNAQVATRTSTSDIEVNIYNAANGGTLLATSDNTVNAPWEGAEFNFVDGTWTFTGANFTFEAGTEYFIEFVATNGNRFFIGMYSGTTLINGEYYRGSAGSLTVPGGYDISCGILFEGKTAQWNSF